MPKNYFPDLFGDITEKEIEEANKKAFEEVKKESLKGDYAVYKPDPILLMRDNMNLTQMRFFEAYLSKIDASNPETYKVRLPIDKVAELAGIDLSNRAEVKNMCRAIESSRFDFKRYVERYEPEMIEPDEEIDRYTISLFDTFKMGRKNGEYFIEVTPGTTMSQMLQKYQKSYATYELQEIYKLSDRTTMRMYSCFKRLEKFGTTNISIELLKSYLGIDQEKYKRAGDFDYCVIKPGVKEINENTDINVIYSPYKKGRGGKIQGWKFTIYSKNPKSAEEQETTKPIEYKIDNNHLVLIESLLKILPEEFNNNLEQADAVRSIVWEVYKNKSSSILKLPEEWKTDIINIVDKFNKQHWLPIAKQKKKGSDTVSYYLKCLQNWLDKNVKDKPSESPKETSYDINNVGRNTILENLNKKSK